MTQCNIEIWIIAQKDVKNRKYFAPFHGETKISWERKRAERERWRLLPWNGQQFQCGVEWKTLRSRKWSTFLPLLWARIKDVEPKKGTLLPLPLLLQYAGKVAIIVGTPSSSSRKSHNNNLLLTVVVVVVVFVVLACGCKPKTFHLSVGKVVNAFWLCKPN